MNGYKGCPGQGETASVVRLYLELGVPIWLSNRERQCWAGPAPARDASPSGVLTLGSLPADSWPQPAPLLALPPPPIPAYSSPQEALTSPTTSAHTSVSEEDPGDFSLAKWAPGLAPEELGFSLGTVPRLSLSKIILFASLFAAYLLPLECNLSEDRDFAPAMVHPSIQTRVQHITDAQETFAKCVLERAAASLWLQGPMVKQGSGLIAHSGPGLQHPQMHWGRVLEPSDPRLLRLREQAAKAGGRRVGAVILAPFTHGGLRHDIVLSELCPCQEATSHMS